MDPDVDMAGTKSTMKMVGSSLRPCLTAPACSLTGASLAENLRTLLISCEAVVHCQKEPEAMMRRAPPSGIVTCMHP